MVVTAVAAKLDNLEDPAEKEGRAAMVETGEQYKSMSPLAITTSTGKQMLEPPEPVAEAVREVEGVQEGVEERRVRPVRPLAETTV
jgi:hypothetical protein